MKRYKVRINDKLFEVEVEEVSSDDNVADNVVDKKEERAARPEQEAPQKPSAEGVSGEKVVAPLPGDISIKVNKGDTINKGELLFVLEAMKMENEITAPAGGTIQEIFVVEGESVESGDVLAIIE
ncbi:MAG TPA: biotin/lipoyl-containing protein [Halanaerobiales bacterium]|nr:biotin/lipoyl-containing protein [Halanaerobiales bacterium]